MQIFGLAAVCDVEWFHLICLSDLYQKFILNNFSKIRSGFSLEVHKCVNPHNVAHVLYNLLYNIVKLCVRSRVGSYINHGKGVWFMDDPLDSSRTELFYKLLRKIKKTFFL